MPASTCPGQKGNAFAADAMRGKLPLPYQPPPPTPPTGPRLPSLRQPRERTVGALPRGGYPGTGYGSARQKFPRCTSFLRGGILVACTCKVFNGDSYFNHDFFNLYEDSIIILDESATFFCVEMAHLEFLLL